MKQSEAVHHLRAMMFGVQRARSIQLEAIAEESIQRQVLEMTSPLIFGGPDKCILTALDRLLTQVDQGSELDPATFLNFMMVASMNPVIDVCLVRSGQTLPQPNIDWVRGWDAEDIQEEAAAS